MYNENDIDRGRILNGLYHTYFRSFKIQLLKSNNTRSSKLIYLIFVAFWLSKNWKFNMQKNFLTKNWFLNLEPPAKNLFQQDYLNFQNASVRPKITFKCWKYFPSLLEASLTDWGDFPKIFSRVVEKYIFMWK